MAKLIYNTDTRQLQKSFSNPAPTTFARLLRAERTATVDLEIFLVDSDGGWSTPGTTTYELLVGRPGQRLDTGSLVLTWTGSTAAIDLSQPKLAARIEQALNSVSEIAAVSGVDVVALSETAYQITFRAVGARAAMSSSVTETAQAKGDRIIEAVAGTAGKSPASARRNWPRSWSGLKRPTSNRPPSGPYSREQSGDA